MEQENNNTQSINIKRNLIIIISLVVVLAGPPPAFGADTGELSVSIHEPNVRIPLPCRAWVNVGDKRFFNPATKSCSPYARDRSFSCDGHFIIRIPAGKAVVHIERGKEYLPVDKEIIIVQNQTTKVDITLKRWISMYKEGWYSSDMHCHFGLDNLEILKQLALADDINLEPILTLWNHQRTSTTNEKWPDWQTGPSVYADATHMVSLRNQEIERIGGDAFESVGALLMFGLTEPVRMPMRNSKYPSDAVLGLAAKRSSPQCVIDTDKPIWSENVIGVALGLFDSVQVCHNHYHRDSTLHLGWGMAADDTDRKDYWGEDELFYRTNMTYYRFLNCGFKLAVTGGSAMGVMSVPLGYNRTYAKLNSPLTEANYLKAIRAGRTFATSGPMLILTANGLDCGSEIQYSIRSKEPIMVKAEVRSIQPLNSLELIYNGKVIKKIDLKSLSPSPMFKKSLIAEIKPLRSGWFAARVIFTSPDGHMRQAHTSPVYIVVDGKPTASKTDAEYMIRWIDRLVQVANKPARYSSDIERAEVQTIFQKARNEYEGIARKAVEFWLD
jgi:hypothetical protein